jgi:hypothetical protein
MCTADFCVGGGLGMYGNLHANESMTLRVCVCVQICFFFVIHKLCETLCVRMCMHLTSKRKRVCLAECVPD